MDSVRIRESLMSLLGPKLPIGKQTLDVPNSSTALTIPAGANNALVTVESDVAAPDPAIRYWVDGSNPTNSEGHARADGDAFELVGLPELAGFRVIEATAGTHTLQITYYR